MIRYNEAITINGSRTYYYLNDKFIGENINKFGEKTNKFYDKHGFVYKTRQLLIKAELFKMSWSAIHG